MATLNETIVEYLEKYGQIQQYGAILDYVNDAGFTAADLQERLDGLVEDGDILRVEDGVMANGEPMVHYAPRA